MRLLRTVSLCVFFLFACSCAPETEDPEQDSSRNPSTRPWFFSQLMECLEEGLWYESASDGGDYLILQLSGGNAVDLPYSEVKIVNCNVFDVPRLFYEEDTGLWRVNLVDSGLFYEDVPDSESYPLCLCYDAHLLKVYLCNGSVIVRGTDPESCLKSFVIEKSRNRSLKEDIVFTQNDGGVVGCHPQTYNNLLYKPSFEFEARSVKVDGEEQTSGESVQDFSSPITYDVEMYDGSSRQYVVRLKSPNDFPTVYLFTDGGAKIADKTNYVAGHIRIEDPLGEYSDCESVDLRMAVKGRGNSTWSYFPKKPYHIKLDEKASVYGMPANRDWIVMANYNDKSLLRNEVAFELSRICGFSWTPRFVPAELYLNNKYMGLYEFGDHKEVAKHRVNINPDDGDFYLELECYPDEPYNFWTSMSVPLTYKDPDTPTATQRKALEGFFSEFESALQGDQFSSLSQGYAAYIDIKSFIDNYIIQELTKNYDGNLHKSSFFTKEKDGKLEFYHIWDFDLSLGNCNFFPGEVGNGPENFYVRYYGFQGYGWGWYYRLFQDKNFKYKVRNRWNELKPQLDGIPDFIDQRADYIREAAGRNFKTWDILRTNVWSQVKICGSFQAEVDYLKQFYTERLEWLDTEINKW